MFCVKKTMVLFVLLMFIFSFNVSYAGIADDEKPGFNQVSATVFSKLYVGGSGPGNYSSIQSAVDNASDGDTVFVYNGTYYENVRVNKTLTLIGEDKNTTVIDGTGGGYAIEIIEKDQVNITGFTIKNTMSKLFDEKDFMFNIRDFSHVSSFTNDVSGVIIASDHNNVSGNRFTGSFWGIVLNSSHKTRVLNNELTENNCGVLLYGDSNGDEINNNKVTSNKIGILIWGSNSNNITNNLISDNDFFGLSLLESNGNVVEKNHFFHSGMIVLDSFLNEVKHNVVNGKPLVYLESESDKKVNNAGQIILVNCDNITVQNQELTFTDVGIELLETHGCYLNNNSVESNNYYGVYLVSSTGNIVENTVVMNNLFGVVLDKSSDDNLLRYNLVEYNYYYGLGISNGFNNSVRNNTFFENQCGINIVGSFNNFSGNIISNNFDGIIQLGSLSVNNSFIKNQICSNTGYGMSILFSDFNNVEFNKIYGNFVGVVAWADNNSLSKNEITDNIKNGVEIHGCNNVVIENKIVNNDDSGVYLDVSSKRNNVVDNYISGNKNGVIITYAQGNNISYNDILNNSNGVLVQGVSVLNVITGNLICSNTLYGIKIEELSNNNQMYHNNFINNSNNSCDMGNNSWCLPYPLGGNYWDDILVDDKNEDGIIDTSFKIPGGSNEDKYPLVKKLPFVKIVKPKKGVYLNNRQILRFFTCVVIGRIEIKVYTFNYRLGVNRVEFYIDHKLKAVDYDEPFNFTLEKTSFMPHNLKIKVFYDTQNFLTEEMRFWKFF